MQTLAEAPIDTLAIGIAVQSKLMGINGVISNIDYTMCHCLAHDEEHAPSIEVTWLNGFISNHAHCDYENVIVIGGEA